MNSAREYHTAVLLKDGRVLIFGGHTGERGEGWLNKTAEIYDPVQNKFLLLDNSPNFVYGGLANVNVLSDGKVYILSIYDAGHYTTEYEFEMFDPQSNDFKVIKSDLSKNTKEIVYNLYKTILLKNDKIFLVGTNQTHYGFLNQIDIYDYKSNKIQNIGSMKIKDINDFETTLLDDGNVLIIGGNRGISAANINNSAEIFAINNLKFYNISKMNDKRSIPSTAAILLNDGRVLITGDGESAEIFVPNKIKK